MFGPGARLEADEERATTATVRRFVVLERAFERMPISIVHTIRGRTFPQRDDKRPTTLWIEPATQHTTICGLLTQAIW